MTLSVDARGMRCPWPAIRMAKALREHPDAVVEIVADDPAAEGELRSVTEAAGRGFLRIGAGRFRAQ